MVFVSFFPSKVSFSIYDVDESIVSLRYQPRMDQRQVRTCGCLPNCDRHQIHKMQAAGAVGSWAPWWNVPWATQGQLHRYSDWECIHFQTLFKPNLLPTEKTVHVSWYLWIIQVTYQLCMFYFSSPTFSFPCRTTCVAAIKQHGRPFNCNYFTFEARSLPHHKDRKDMIRQVMWVKQ